MPAQVFVFIPAYNNALFLTKAIESVINQTYKDWELVIIDDASSDATFEISKAYEKKDKRINAFRNDHNLGMVGNWNKGISFCQSEYFIKLDADDVWAPNMLERAMAIMEIQFDVALIFSNYINIDGDGNLVSGSEPILPKFARNRSFSCIPLVNLGADKMLQYPILRQGLSLMRSSIFDQLGNYRYLKTIETQASSDTEFYFRVGCHHLIYCIDEVLYFYRVHKNSISALNSANGFSSQKLFEMKTTINDYYFSQNKISTRNWKSNKDEINFAYIIHLNYLSRLNKDYFVAVKLTMKLIFIYPIRTFCYLKQRYLNR